MTKDILDKKSSFYENAGKAQSVCYSFLSCTLKISFVKVWGEKTLVIAQMLIYSSEPVYYGHHVTYYHDTPILIIILFHYDDKTWLW